MVNWPGGLSYTARCKDHGTISFLVCTKTAVWFSHGIRSFFPIQLPQPKRTTSSRHKVLLSLRTHYIFAGGKNARIQSDECGQSRKQEHRQHSMLPGQQTNREGMRKDASCWRFIPSLADEVGVFHRREPARRYSCAHRNHHIALRFGKYMFGHAAEQ